MAEQKVDTNLMRSRADAFGDVPLGQQLRAAADELDALRAEVERWRFQKGPFRGHLELTEENERLKRRVAELTEERDYFRSRSLALEADKRAMVASLDLSEKP